MGMTIRGLCIKIKTDTPLLNTGSFMEQVMHGPVAVSGAAIPIAKVRMQAKK